ncbi:carboxypeptidase-like regulatory domain-containing protein [Phocaeicola dorei]|nr:carboxypeptidase-like regulatory domain-containing protein [Phocaeicola dorei]
MPNKYWHLPVKYRLPGIESGRVTDANNEPLIGVSIVIQGNSGGTITDIDGRYTLEEVDADATLVFSYIGYVPQKIVVGNQQILNVQMKEDNQTLEEVVVIGYGVQKKRDMTRFHCFY